MKITIETTIAAAPEIVFATIADIARWPDFIEAIERIEMLTSGGLEVGTRFRETRTMFGRSATEEMTVAALEVPARMVLTASNHGTRYRATHELRRAEAGTRLELAFEGVPASFAAKLLSVVGVLFVAPLRRQLAADLADVKAEAERRARL